VLKEIPDASIHPFCFETIQPEATAHARDFSSPASGTLEDAVTGTASGVMGAYFARYVDGLTALKQSFVIEQVSVIVGKDQSIAKVAYRYEHQCNTIISRYE
jgi:trans-2,3-dihydro-3-hydroxyanthranilate isomerase